MGKGPGVGLWFVAAGMVVFRLVLELLGHWTRRAGEAARGRAPVTRPPAIPRNKPTGGGERQSVRPNGDPIIKTYALRECADDRDGYRRRCIGHGP